MEKTASDTASRRPGASASTTLPRRPENIFSLIDVNDPDLKQLEELTRRLAQEDFSLLRSSASASGTRSNEAGDGDNDDHEDDDDNDDDGARRSRTLSKEEDIEQALLEEFRALAQAHQQQVPKLRLKELYVEMLRQGDSLLRDRQLADSFLGKLMPQEMDALMTLMQKDADEIVQFFDGDREVLDAIKQSPAMASRLAGTSAAGGSGSGKWSELERELLATGGKAAGVSSTKQRSPAVQSALEVFEQNMLHYAQNPDELLRLSSSLPSAKDQDDFLDILFTEYTPERMQQRMAQLSAGSSSSAATATATAPSAASRPSVNHDLVANVFKEIFMRFRTYKKYPHKFDALVQRLNEEEQLQLEALVRTFWNASAEDLKL